MRFIAANLAIVIILSFAPTSIAGDGVEIGHYTVQFTSTETKAAAEAKALVAQLISTGNQRLIQTTPRSTLIYSSCGPTHTPCCCKAGAYGSCMTHDDCEEVGGECVEQAPGC